jgi:hypothetical protein
MLAVAASHEINNPLMALIASLELLEKTQTLDADGHARLGVALAAAWEIKEKVWQLGRITRCSSIPASQARSTTSEPGASRSAVTRVRASIGAFVARRVRRAPSRRAVWLAAPVILALLLLVVVAGGLAHHLYFDRTGLPDIEPFIRFELSTIGTIYDARGTVLVELAREYRRVVSYDDVPSILRDAILAAEDKNFFAHSGVEYRALPRVVYKTAVSSARGWWNRDGFRLRFPQGGSTLTQQLVRGYFLQDRWSRENGAALFRDSRVSRLVALIVGVPTMVRQAALKSARDTARPPSFDDGLPAGPRPGTPAVDTKVQ